MNRVSIALACAMSLIALAAKPLVAGDMRTC